MERLQEFLGPSAGSSTHWPEQTGRQAAEGWEICSLRWFLLESEDNSVDLGTGQGKELGHQVYLFISTGRNWLVVPR